MSEGPWEGKRYKIIGLNNRCQYVEVDTNGIIVTFPDNKHKNKNYQCTATALARMISIAMQNGVSTDIILKQLKESSLQKGDTPDVLLTALTKYVGGV